VARLVGLAEALCHPAAHRIVPAGEPVRVVCVKAFDAPSRPPDPSARAGPIPTMGYGRIAFSGVAQMCRSEFAGAHRSFSRPDAASRLQAVYRPARLLADQPIEGGHRCAVVEQGSIADDQRLARLVAHNDFELPSGLSP
jgi:hypothetical protein